MRGFTTMFFSLLLVGILTLAFFTPVLNAGIGESGTIAADAGKAKTVKELIEMYDSDSCAECHKEIYDQWKKSLHARSIFGPEESGRTAATFRTTLLNGLKKWKFSGVAGPEDVKVEHLRICTKCHLPQLEDATDEVASEIMNMIVNWAEEGDEKAEETIQALNINCLICHNRNAITHKWTDGYPQKGVVYGTKDGDHFSESMPEMRRSPIMQESILCGQCHGLGPNLELDNPTQCATLYGYYLWSYQAEGGRETCQECHMKKSKLGHNIQSYRSSAMREAALDFKVEVTGFQWRDGSKMVPLTEVVVEMTNKAGHAIPDG